MNSVIRVTRLKRLQRCFVGLPSMATTRAAMSTVKIPRRLYESARQTWSQLSESANDRWRKMLVRDQVTKLEPRLGVRLDDEDLGVHSEIPGAPKIDVNLGHDIPKDDVFDRALRDEKLSPKKMQEKPVVAEKARETESRPQSLLRNSDDIDARSRNLIRAIATADLPSILCTSLEKFSEHILAYPHCRARLIHDKALSVLLKRKMESSDEAVLGLTRECLSILGYVEPPKSAGVRILSIDGGGVRGLLVIEVLRQLEMCTGKRISELFDYVVGVSTGAILVAFLTSLQKDLDDCYNVYRGMSSTVFQQSSWWGTGKLVWNHAYYDTKIWQDILKGMFGERRLVHSSRIEGMPRVGILSAVVNKPQLVPFLFRNYLPPPKEESFYTGDCHPYVWQAIRASSSAPFYFEELELNGDVHQDGGIIQNNPTAAGIHEARLLWPQEKIQCVVSIGSGRYIPDEDPTDLPRSTSLRTKIHRIVDSATDTEAVHTLCNDLLAPGTYFRFNPYLSEPFTLDETRPEKMDGLRRDAQMYLRRNDKKFERAAELLVQPRSILQRCKDYVRDNIQERLV